MLSGTYLTQRNLLSRSLFSTRYRFFSLLMLVQLLAFSVRADDVPGSADPRLLERYPISYIVEFSQQPEPEYWLALGPMKKVNGLIRPESSEVVSGHLTRITYRIPDGHDSGEAYAHYVRQLGALGYLTRYECAGRRCGSSNQWANSQFGIAQLYGVDRDQYYGAFNSADGNQIVAIYSVRRGNKRIYLHLDFIDSADAQVGVMPLAFSLAGRVYVTLGDPLESLAAALKARYQQDPAFSVRLVGHSGRGNDAAARQTASLIDAERVRDRLVVLGVPSSLLRTYGIGDLAPAYVSDVPSERVEVLLE